MKQMDSSSTGAPPLIDAPLNGVPDATMEGVSIQADAAPKRMKLGFDLLKKAGYSGIGGLGKQESGIAEPVSVVVAQESVGLGFVGENDEMDKDDVKLGARADEDEGSLDAVVIRVVPSLVRDEEVLGLASRWGGVRRYLRQDGTFVLELAVVQHAQEMVARYKRQGLKLGGVDVQCFLGSLSMLDDADGVVEVGRPTGIVQAHVDAPPLNQVSKLLQSLGARLTPLPADDGDDADGIEKKVEPEAPKSTATASFLQQALKKSVTSDLLSSINKILDKKKRARDEEPSDEMARVLCDFDAQDSSQVSIRVGDVVVLKFRDEKSGWSEVEFGNNIGWVPSSYLEK